MSSRDEPRILIAGFGNMGRALVRGWLDAGMTPAAITVADESEQARSQARRWALPLFDDAMAGPFDVLVLAVKPQHIDAALQQYAAALAASGVLLSIAAGRTIDSLQEHLDDGSAIVRSMPNTPAAIAQGTTVLCANTAVNQAQREQCTRLLSAVGAVFWVDDEMMLDAVTAVSGSGPAYVFLLIECLTAAGVRHGLSPELAAELARHTVAGSGAYALACDVPVATLREQVTSPGGTTAAALGVFMRDEALQKLVDEAVDAAAARSAELSSG
jgi:pyrroline-5-carboxylate reductase